MSDLGSLGQPNGNAFYSMSEEVNNSGANTGFDYYAFDSPNELFPISGFPGGVFQNTGKPATNACGGGIGVNRIAGTSYADILEMMDSLKYKVGTPEVLAEYGHNIVKYYKDNNMLSDLENYASSIAGINLEAYNSITLFLMEHYRAEGQETKAQGMKNSLKSKNSSNQEIIDMTDFFDVSKKIWDNPGYSAMGLEQNDSLALDKIIKSGNGVSDQACLLLRLFSSNCECGGRTKPGNGNESQNNHSAQSQLDYYLGSPIPNPATYETLIEYKLTDSCKTASIAIYTLHGTQVKEFTLNCNQKFGSVSVDVSGYQNGVYAYSLIINGMPVETKKLVVVK